MADNENFKVQGVVVEALPSTMFRVEVETVEDQAVPNSVDMIVLCTLSGKMRKNRIKVLLGDHVEVEVTPYDLTRGRIVRRR